MQTNANPSAYAPLSSHDARSGGPPHSAALRATPRGPPSFSFLPPRSSRVSDYNELRECDRGTELISGADCGDITMMIRPSSTPSSDGRSNRAESAAALVSPRVPLPAAPPAPPPPPPPPPSDARIAALLDEKLLTSVRSLDHARSLRLRLRGLTDADCLVLAHLISRHKMAGKLESIDLALNRVRAKTCPPQMNRFRWPPPAALDGLVQTSEPTRRASRVQRGTPLTPAPRVCVPGGRRRVPPCGRCAVWRTHGGITTTRATRGRRAAH